MLKGEVSAVALNKSIQSNLDFHDTNMIVVGKHCFIISHSEKCIDVNAFADAVGGLSQVPIVDAAINYDCPYTHKLWLIIVRNVLNVGSMNRDLIPPFILREVYVTCYLIAAASLLTALEGLVRQWPACRFFLERRCVK